MSKSLIRKNQLHPDIADLVGEYGSGYFISNQQDQQTVFITGDQTISGTKFFADYIELINPNYGIVFNNNSSTYATNVVGNRTGITLSTFQSPTDINIKSDFVGGFVEDVISVRNLNNTGMFGPSINYDEPISFNQDSIIFYQTGQGYATIFSKGPYLRLGYHNIISETTGSRLGIGTLFPQEKVHISGGRLRVDGNIIANNVVYNTGNQTISGNKTFLNSIFYGLASGSFDLGLRTNISSGSGDSVSFTRGGTIPSVHGYGIVFEGGSIANKKGYLTVGATVAPVDYQYASLDWTSRILSGNWRASSPISVGSAVSVMTTGDQTISGAKTFVSRPTVNGTGVLLSGDFGLEKSLTPNLYLRTSSQDTNGNNAGGIVTAVSEDGIKWNSLNRNVNFPSFSRDASTIWYNNQWVSVYTNAFTSTGKNFGIATSTNLTSWITGSPVLLTGPATTGIANNVWAPEWFVDSGQYYVLVRLSTTSGNNYGSPGMGYVKSLNPGTWTSWTDWTPFDNSVRIDANDFYIVKKENLYWLFSHGGTHLNGKQPPGSGIINNICMQYSTTPFSGYSSLVEITEPFRNIIRPGNTSAFFEGNSVINIGGTHWRLYFQDGLNNSLWSVDSFDDFQSWPTGSLRKNFYEGFNGAGHGTVLKIDEKNYVGITAGLLNINSPISIGAVALTGNQTISGIKTFATGIVAPNGIDLQNSPIINSIPQLVTQTGNFSISGNSNGRMIISNASTLITGTIMSGNATGFNASIIQVGAGQIQITGVGAGIKIDSYNNQYRTAGQFATVSLLHTGNNGYIMYGNTSS